uniref:PPM-type phosphatase domain-containing protein n=1 Tax=Arcella intermedia TaxID=1963864 RepID=A0A6B2L8Z1_9EUKA|eukprot:TRINITY_DN2855_c0_g1_i1.p1 TRINITY_DN2855_c0_g1~~TRINITY_DN2855_c0_g1_i1.p1  ORF type:complete len:347 (+),score=55.62 TRINITY_DN2855_c0_g1_i1:126-1166(+)
MGLGLTHPVASKILYRKGNAHFRVGAASMHGWRETMEDAHTILLSLERHQNSAFFGIFDGHSGSLCSKYVAQNLHKKLDEKLEDFNDEKLLKELVMEVDQDFLDSEVYRNKDDGSAGIFTIATHNNETKLYSLVNANIGDSRIVLAKKKEEGYETIPCTDDHKPTNEAERKRIEAAGGSVQLSRVDGQLALSRAFGDRMLKHPMSLPPADRKVTSNPDVFNVVVSSGDFLFLACDGIYEGDVFSRDSVIKFIVEKLKETNDLAVVCAQVLDECLKRGSRDNMSAMIVQFQDGSDYHSDKNEYVPGPYHTEEGDGKFQEAYKKDALESGYTLEQALELYKKNSSTDQ